MNPQSENDGPVNNPINSPANGPVNGPIEIASSNGATRVRGTGVEVGLQVNGAALSKMVPALAATGRSAKASRMTLVLENVRGTFDAAVLRVHLRIAAPDGGNTAAEVQLGSLGLFGLRLASLPKPDGTRGGMQYRLDATPALAHYQGAVPLAQAQFHVAIHPHTALPDGVEIVIERMCMCVETT